MTYEIIDMDLSGENLNKIARNVLESFVSNGMDEASTSILAESIEWHDKYEATCKAIGASLINQWIMGAVKGSLDQGSDPL